MFGYPVTIHRAAWLTDRLLSHMAKYETDLRYRFVTQIRRLLTAARCEEDEAAACLERRAAKFVLQRVPTRSLSSLVG